MLILHAPIKQPIASLWYSALGGIALSVFIVLILIIFSAGGACTGSGCGLLSPVILAPLTMIIVLVVLMYPFLYWYLFSFELSEHAITVNSGILFRQYETIDFGRIQVVDNERGPLLWLFGLTVINIWTASADQMSFNVHGRNMEARPHPDASLVVGATQAEEIKNFITEHKPQAPGL